MKLSRLLLPLLLASASLYAGGPPPASVDFIVVNKLENFTQTGPATVSQSVTEPFKFEVHISGESITTSFPLGPNTFVAPAGSAMTGTISLGAPTMNNSEWNYDQSFASKGALDTAFANGTYSLTFGGQPINLSLTGDAYPNIPQITASANGDATWLPNGTLLYYAGNNNPLTLTSNLFTSTASLVHIGLFVDATQGQNMDFADFQADYFGPGTGSLTISQTFMTASEFVMGTTYRVNLEFNVVTHGIEDLTTIYGSGNGYDNGIAVAVYSRQTSFNMLVIPEPSSYAALAGAGVFALAVWQRRRRKV